MQEPDNSVWHAPEHVRQYVERQRKSSPIEAELFAVLARLLWSLGERPKHVLDLGCGAGRFGRAIMDVFDWIEVTFSDFSAEMLKAARQAVPTDENKRASFQEADLTQPGWLDAFGTQRFDAVVSGFSLHHVPAVRRREVVSEVQQLMRPGGLFVIVEWVDSPSPWLEDIHNRWYIETKWHGGGFEGEDVTFEQTLAHYANRDDIQRGLLLPMDEQINWLRETGYTDVSCYWKTFDMAVFGGIAPKKNR